MSSNALGTLNLSWPDLTGATQSASVDPSTGTSGDTSNPSSSWSGLDSLGGSVSGVASGILSSFGNLVSAQINNKALLTSTGATTAPLTNAPAANPNVWHAVMIGGIVLAGAAAIYLAVRKRR